MDLNEKLKENRVILDFGMFSFVILLFYISIKFGLFIPFLFGAGTFLVIRVVELFIKNKLLIKNRSRSIATFIISFVIILALVAFFQYLISIINKLANNPNEIINQTSIIIDKSIKDLPESISKHIPNNFNEIKDSILVFVKNHLVSIRDFGKETTSVFIGIMFGIVIGIMIAYSTFNTIIDKELTKSFTVRMINLIESYKHIVIAQVAISAFNTLMTTIFLYILKTPLIGIEFPFIKTIILLTFILGLIPIFGNIIINTIIFIIGLSVSVSAGLIALTYLIIIHKFEYVLNAKIIGTRTESRAWELLLSMLVMESIFGIIGLISAPIIYTYIRKELKNFKLI